jgi:D-glycero-D-manno-heptose 1,7-bisphosphate phosphatase
LNKALFLDRDGVINVNQGFFYSKKNFEFIDGIFDLVRAAREKGYLVFVVTNQAGIGRGYFSEKDFCVLTEWMCQVFNLNNASIDKVYFSPYDPILGIGGYRKNHHTRKPNPGMLLQAEQEFNLSLVNSILVGDQGSDIRAGLSAGVGINLLFSGSVPPELEGLDYEKVIFLKQVTRYLNNLCE